MDGWMMIEKNTSEMKDVQDSQMDGRIIGGRELKG